MVAEVKALACELPAKLGLPLSRFSRSELRRHVIAAGIVAEISGVTIWRWLREDALRPWSRRSWISPRDPDFAEKAGRVLDLYHRRFEGRALRDDEFVICADEKTQIPIRTRLHPITPPGPGRPIRVEHEYRRHGVCAYIAAWDVHRARLFGDVVTKISIPAFDTLVARVMSDEPYRSARRVFWIVDNGTIHRGQCAVDRLHAQHDNLTLIHLPKHASWINQIEIYFSILQRKALTPADFSSENAVATRILGFQDHYEAIAEPFE
ncbi:MAG: IS630 family transposase [Longimicrobiales bacterium]|nr:IS630 family transposase [Longimicrobiales bacterium]